MQQNKNVDIWYENIQNNLYNIIWLDIFLKSFMILNISWNLCDYKSLEIRDLKYVIRFV